MPRDLAARRWRLLAVGGVPAGSRRQEPRARLPAAHRAPPTNPDALSSPSHSPLQGFMFCNGPELRFAPGSTTRFAMLGLGSETDLHSVSFGGSAVRDAGAVRATAEVMPASTRVVDVRWERSGRWPVLCSVHDHWEGGMVAAVTVA